MSKAIAVIIASALMLGSPLAMAKPGWGEGMHHGGKGMKGGCDMMNGRHSMDDQDNLFYGVQLSEQQRQQMRDLMRNSRRQMGPMANPAHMESMHKLITADKFDEAAARKQIESMSQQRIERQVEMARLRHEMYNQLTPQQKAQIEENFQKRLKYRQQGGSETEAPAESTPAKAAPDSSKQ